MDAHEYAGAPQCGAGGGMCATLVMKAMGHPARWQILNALREGEECVCHLTALLRQRQAYVSQQLMFLRQAGLIQDRKDGLRVYYMIKDPRVLNVMDAVALLAGEEPARPHHALIAACVCPRCQSSGECTREETVCRRREGRSRP